MNWKPTTEPPPLGARVLGVILYRFSNADWKWSEPHTYTYELGHNGEPRWSSDYMPPDAWCEIVLPALPDTAEHRAAKEKQTMLKDLEAQRRELDLTYRAVLNG